MSSLVLVELVLVPACVLSSGADENVPAMSVAKEDLVTHAVRLVLVRNTGFSDL